MHGSREKLLPQLPDTNHQNNVEHEAITKQIIIIIKIKKRAKRETNKQQTITISNHQSNQSFTIPSRMTTIAPP